MVMPPDDRPRASRTIKLVLMGIAGAALLYSCTPGVGGMGIWPWLWFWGNPFSRSPMVSTPGGSTATSSSPTQAQPSQRGGFGNSAGEHGSGTS